MVEYVVIDIKYNAILIWTEIQMGEEIQKCQFGCSEAFYSETHKSSISPRLCLNGDNVLLAHRTKMLTITKWKI